MVIDSGLVDVAMHTKPKIKYAVNNILCELDHIIFCLKNVGLGRDLSATVKSK